MLLFTLALSFQIMSLELWFVRCKIQLNLKIDIINSHSECEIVFVDEIWSRLYIEIKSEMRFTEMR